MNYCNNCGDLISPNQNYCDKCGIQVNTEVTEGSCGKFIDGTINVGPTTIVVGPATYLTKDIHTISYKETDKTPASTTINGIIGAAAIGAIFAFTDNLSQLDVWDYLFLALAIFMVISSLITASRSKFYSVEIHTSFGDTSIFEINNRAKAETIVNAIKVLLKKIKWRLINE